MEVEVRWEEDVRFSATSDSGHTVTLDGAVEAGGKNAGARPMELMLMGMGGCASFDVMLMLKKGREPVSDCVAKLTATRAPEPPRVFTHICLHFVVSGDGLSERKVARAVELSAQKYCSASIMLARGGVEITHSYEVVETSAKS